MALNEITKTDNQEIPNMDEILDAMQGSKYFSVIDLKEGYFQIHVAEADKHKTAFTVNGIKYEWNRMPMGFKNAPLIFQRIMNFELNEYLYKGCAVYMDDVVIYGKTIEEHDSMLRNVLNKFKEKNFKINSEKLQVSKSQIKLLGMVIDGNTVAMPEETRQKVFEFQIPKTKKELQRFLGTINGSSIFRDRKCKNPVPKYT